MSGKAKLAGWGLAAMLAIATPLVAEWEGKSNTPRWDAIGKRWEVCYGDTETEMRPHTDAECMALLRKKLGNHYGEAVKRCVPALEHRPFQWAASASLSYNVGIGGFCRSTAAKRFNAGDWKGGCEAFKVWVISNGEYVEGLANRRWKGGGGRVPEYDACVAGL